MDDVICAVKIGVITILLLGAAAIFSLLKSTEVKTTFLCTIKWFTKYTLISQRPVLMLIFTIEIRRKYKNKPIREMLSEYNRQFREDFSKLFEHLERNVHYRVVTHYKDVMQAAVDEQKISLLDEPKLKAHRLVREIKPLIGWRDYRIIKKCLKANPNISRCCDNCKKLRKCQCTKGGVCKLSILKKFYEYDFVVNK